MRGLAVCTAALLPTTFTPERSQGVVLDIDAIRSPRTMAAGMAAQFNLTSSRYLSNAGTALLRGAVAGWHRSGWLYLDSTATDQVVISCSTILDNVGFDLRYLTASGKLSLTVGNGAAEKVAADGTVLNSATWYHWYIEYDGTNIGISVNNNALTQTALTAAYSPGAAALNIGASLAPLLYFDGRMQCIEGNDGVATTAQRTILYGGGTPQPFAALQSTINPGFMFELNEPSGARADLVAALSLTSNNTVGTAAGTCLNAVGQTNDLSGYGNHASQSTQAAKAVLRFSLSGAPCLRFDGVDDTMLVNGVATLLSGTDLPYTVFVVAQSLVSQNQFYISWGNSGSVTQFAGLQDDTTNFRQRKVDDAAATGQITGGVRNANPLIVGISDSGTTGVLSVNGTPSSGSTNVGAITLDKARIGSFGRTTDTNFLAGSIARVIASNQGMVPQVTSQLTRYLGRRHAIVRAA